jgi:hypothetical protein
VVAAASADLSKRGVSTPHPRGICVVEKRLFVSGTRLSSSAGDRVRISASLLTSQPAGKGTYNDHAARA